MYAITATKRDLRFHPEYETARERQQARRESREQVQRDYRRMDAERQRIAAARVLTVVEG